MDYAANFWQANRLLAQACLQHPFVQGLATGQLSVERFADYIGQDSFFLQSFARAYSLAAAKAPNWASVCTFHQLAGGVIQELQLHQAFAADWQVDLNVVQPNPATQRYTDFLQLTAWSSDLGTLAAAMAPCMRLYAYLGQNLASTQAASQRYSAWIETYSSNEFEALVRQLEQLVNQHSYNLASAAQAYRYAMQCEYDFFEAVWSN